MSYPYTPGTRPDAQNDYPPITWPNTLSEIVSGGAILMLLVVWLWVL